MTARIVDCPTPGCAGKAEFLSTAGIYLCVQCGGRFGPIQIRLPAKPPGAIPFHGRAGELALMEGALESARGGRAQVVLVHGEPGIGKTALMRSFYHGMASPASDPYDYWPDVVGELTELSRESSNLCASRRGKKVPFLWLAGQAPSPQIEACLPLHPWVQALEGLRNLPLGTDSRQRTTEVAKVVGQGVLDIGADLLGIGLVKTLVETTVGVHRAIRARRGPACDLRGGAGNGPRDGAGRCAGSGPARKPPRDSGAGHLAGRPSVGRRGDYGGDRGLLPHGLQRRVETIAIARVSGQRGRREPVSVCAGALGPLALRRGRLRPVGPAGAGTGRGELGSAGPGLLPRGRTGPAPLARARHRRHAVLPAPVLQHAEGARRRRAPRHDPHPWWRAGAAEGGRGGPHPLRPRRGAAGAPGAAR